MRAPEAVQPPPPAPTQVGLLLAGLVVVVGAAAASVALGTRFVALPEVWGGLTGNDGTIAEAAVAKRIPRTVLAVMVGAALGVSGAVLQGVTRNPLADPGIFGVSQGAALFVVTGIAFFSMSSPTAYLWVAILGAAASAVFVYGVASAGRGGATPLKLALAGAVTAAAATSLVSAILLPRVDVMNVFRFWQVGGVGGATPERIGQVLPFLLVGFGTCLLCARGLNSLALGDEVAAGLGERVWAIRLVSTGGAVVLCGAATAVAGPIGFVGLVIPHLSRMLVGLDHRWLLPMSALAGAALLSIADVVGRVVARPAEVDVGIVTALIGAPVFIVLVRRMKVRGL